MKNHIAKRGEFDVNFYQEYLAGLYSRINTKRSFENIYGYVHRTIGHFGKTIDSESTAPEDFVLPISWIFSLATKLNVKLQDAVLRKYPGICPYCLESICVCYRTKKQPLVPIPLYKVKEEKSAKRQIMALSSKVYNLEAISLLIRDIYTVNEVIWLTAGPWRHIAKLSEELAEIHEAHGSYRKNEKPLSSVADEVADIFAWMLGAWGIMYSNKSLDDLFVSYYYSGCPVCRERSHCVCGLYDSRLESLLDFSKISAFEPLLMELANTYPVYYVQASNLVSTFKEVLISQNEPVTKLTLFETKRLIGDISETFIRHRSGEEDEQVKKGLQRINSISDLIDDLLQDDKRTYPKPPEFDIFLSFSSLDKDEAREIYTFLRDQNIRVFLSEATVSPGLKWERVVKEALSNTEMLCVLSTPSSLKSEWVLTEWAVAWGKDLPVLPILLRCSVNDLPERLKSYQSIDFHEFKRIPDILKELSVKRLAPFKLD